MNLCEPVWKFIRVSDLKILKILSETKKLFKGRKYV